MALKNIDKFIPNVYNATGGQITETNTATTTRTAVHGSTYGQAGNGLGIPNATKSGYDLKGWYITTTGSDSIPVTASKTVLSSDHVVFAQWEESVPKTAYAVYSATDNSLSFYKSATPITAGSTYNGKVATAVYTGFETTDYTSTANVPWNSNRTNIKKVNVVDEIKPISTAYWFDDCKNVTTLDLTKLNTSNVTNMRYMFQDAGYNASTITLTGLNTWDTSNVTNMYYMFGFVGYNASTVNLDLSGWNTSGVTSSAYMFSSVRKLKEITIGTGFTLISQLPTPDSTYITGADGLWYNKTTGVGYMPETIPSGTAATYTAVNPGVISTNLTVYFNANGGSVSQTSKKATSGNPYGTLPTPTRAEYQFLGWYTSTSGGTKITSTTIISKTGTQYLYAQWTANYCYCPECNNLTDNWLCASCSIDANGDGYETTCMGCGVCENHRAVCSNCLLCANCGCTHGISGGGSGGIGTCATCGHDIHLGYTCDAQEYTDCRYCDGDYSCNICGGKGWYYYTCGCFDGV